ncbi:MAG: 2-enoate reductase, partial [Oscillospiraceae bacterium]|nr:2-enoate reductase [Oscillospiraceae bacterium]
MSVNQFPHLFEPLQVRGQTFKNRIFSAPQGYYNVTPDAYPNGDMIAYFEAKARGGMASVCIGDGIVHTPTGTKGSVPHLDDPTARVHLAYLANAINRHGAVAAMELNHAGMYSHALVREG